MRTQRNRNGGAKPLTPVCFQCGRRDRPLQRACLTGMGDHPRRFLVCDECIAGMLARSPSHDGVRPQPTRAMTEAEKRYETRRQKAFDRLGTDQPRCACCSQTDWRCMELHHLEGEHFGKTLVVVCRNCHRKLSDPQKDHPSQFADSPTTFESIGHFLLGLADLLLLLANKCWEFGQYLIEQARQQPGDREPPRS
jgi:hypothetical protein